MPRTARPSVLLAYATFVLIGIYSGSGGVLLVAQMSSYGVDRATIGIMFFTGSAGFVLAGFNNGALIQRLGFRMALVVGSAAFGIVSLYLGTRPPFVLFLLVQLILGYGCGVLEGSGCSTRTGAGPGWQPDAPSESAEPAASSGLLPEPPAAGPGGPRGLLGTVLRERGVLLGALFLAVYVGLEIGMGNWGFSYLVQARDLSRSLASYSISGYWLGLTVGRFVISPIAARIGASTGAMVYTCLIGVIAATVLAWLSPSALLASAALLLLGVFLGPIFPTTMAIVPQLTQERLGPAAIGVLNAGAIVGGSALPWLVGVISQATGIWALLPFTLALGALQFLAWRPLARRIRTPRAANE